MANSTVRRLVVLCVQNFPKTIIDGHLPNGCYTVGFLPIKGFHLFPIHEILSPPPNSDHFPIHFYEEW